MLAYCDLLNDENTDKVNCKADLHFQAFHQNTLYSKRIKLCASLAAVVYLTFRQQIAHFLVISRSTISIHSTFIGVHFPCYSVAFYLQAIHIYMHT